MNNVIQQNISDRRTNGKASNIDYVFSNLEIIREVYSLDLESISDHKPTLCTLKGTTKIIKITKRELNKEKFIQELNEYSAHGRK